MMSKHAYGGLGGIVTGDEKRCYCFTCDRYFHSLGIARHRASHRDKKENCKIRFSDFTVRMWNYGEKEPNQ